MLRAGPLSSEKVIVKLHDDFVNTWIIISQFESPEEFFENEIARKWAETIKREFTYPVDSIILSPDGVPVAQLEVIKASQESAYEKLLADSLDE